MTKSTMLGVACRAAALFAFLASFSVVGLAGQPPEEEEAKPKGTVKKVPLEKEDPKGTIKKRIVVDEGPAKAAGHSTPDKQLDELAAAAAATPEPTAKDLFSRYSVPFDKFSDNKGRTFRIKPIPLFRGQQFPKQFGIQEFNAKNKLQPVRNVAVTEMKRIDYFEELVLGEIDGLGKAGSGLEEGPRLAISEKLLAAALRYHDYARENNLREGKLWDTTRTNLVERLREVRLSQLRQALTESDWKTADQIGSRLLAAYPRDAAIAQEVAVARIARAEILIKSRSFTDHVQARNLLEEFESRFPGAGAESVKRIRRELTLEATRLFERARGFKKQDNLVDARNDLTRAAQLDPTLPGLRELQKELGTSFPVLYVGARVFPEKMSPATARFDSELQAVQLVFEGLLETVPEGRTGGTRYRPGAALALPTVLPAGREILVRQFSRESNPQDGFDAYDVIETVKMLQSRPELRVSAALPWLDDVPTPTGRGGLRFQFKHGHPDPLSLFTFRLLPARWLNDRGKKVDDIEFAARPFGTGPYRIHSIPDVNAPGRRELAFIDNPLYGRWRDRAGLPHIREIRLVDLSRLDGRDPLDEFRRGELHIIPDLTPSDMARIISEGGAGIAAKGQIVTAGTNRRVHILAVNHRRPYLRNKDLRLGLTQAIDREGIVFDLFRAPRAENKRFTAPMTGPFPPASWATVKGPANQPIPLMNRDQALVHFRRYLDAPGTAEELHLAYLDADPLAGAACQRIKADIEGLFKGGNGKKLTITLDALAPRDFLRRLEEEHRYDLAYMPFDYPDDWYPFGLAAFLDPTAAGRNGRNVTGFLSPGTNPDAADLALRGELAALYEHRDFTGDLAPRAERIHRLFNESVPFVPLWHLDRHALVYNGLKIYVDDSSRPVTAHVLDPTLLFHNVARWRLE